MIVRYFFILAFLLTPLTYANENRVLSEIAKLEDEPAVQASVRVERGGPRLFINEEETYPLFAWSFRLLDYTPQFRQAGIEIIYPILHISDGWLSENRYDWSQFDKFFDSLLKLHPEACFLPRLLLYAPDWWKEKHPDALVASLLPFNESMNITTDSLLIGEGGQRWWRNDPQSVSFASSFWKDEMTGMLKQFIDYYEQSPLKSRIIGYHFGSGTTGGEWHYFHSWFLPDTSPAMQDYMDYIPDLESRVRTDYGLFRDPSKQPRVIDYYKRLHHLTADLICHYAEVIKNTTQNRLLCGVFYNYLLENVFIQEGGHLAPQPVLESPHIDFIASPYTYQSSNRKGAARGETDVYDQAGNWLGRGRGLAGDGGYRLLLTSIKRHGKLPFVELDPATFVDKGRDMDYAGSGSNTVEGSLMLMQRDLGQMFVTGSGGWLCDIGAVKGEGWYAPPVVVNEINKWMELGEKRARLDVSSVSDVAAVYDAKSFFVTKHWYAEKPWEKGAGYQDFFEYWFCDSQARAFHRLGAPMDFLYRFDLNVGDMEKYKLLFMVNLFYLDASEIDRLQNLLKNSGVTVVWYYAPGFVSPDRLDPKAMQRLSGFQFDILEEPGPMLIQCELPGRENNTELMFGTRARKRFPRFSVRDRDVEILGRWADNALPAFVRKQIDGYTSVYVGTAPLPVPVLRWLCRQAGAKLWSTEGDIVRASEDAVMLVATSGGKRRLDMHKNMLQVNGRKQGRTLELDMKRGEVGVFVAE
jgi:hypothetical protein